QLWKAPAWRGDLCDLFKRSTGWVRLGTHHATGAPISPHLLQRSVEMTVHGRKVKENWDLRLIQVRRLLHFRPWPARKPHG
ncbi:hypothetical protein, partial [Phenylobacterium sp.]|uniref:hypothetical protein n=1 Tax=Phenylobacterium sp. TaxID=1871053 RepID=UPI0027335843